MAQWIEKKENWLPGSERKQPGPEENVYSVAEVADLLKITKPTVMKWLSIDESKLAVIPPNAWFKLPNGYIRIREWIVLKLKAGEI